MVSNLLFGLPWWLRGYSVCLQCRGPGFDPWVRKIPWRRKWQPTTVHLRGKSHGRRSLVDYSPWDRKELDTLFSDCFFKFSNQKSSEIKLTHFLILLFIWTQDHLESCWRDTLDLFKTWSFLLKRSVLQGLFCLTWFLPLNNWILSYVPVYTVILLCLKSMEWWTHPLLERICLCVYADQEGKRNTYAFYSFCLSSVCCNYSMK